MRTTCGGGSNADFDMDRSFSSETKSFAGPLSKKRARKSSLENRSSEASSPVSSTLLGFCDESVPSFNAAPKLKDGCTVEGYVTGQNFTSTWCDTEETYTSVKVFLQGFEVEKPIAVVEPSPKKKRNGSRKRPTSKNMRLNDLEAENDKLRRKLAEIENKELKAKLKASE